MKLGRILIRIVLILFMFIQYGNVNSIFDGNIWGAHYLTIGLGSVLILATLSFLIFRKGALEIHITTINILLLLLMTYIGIQLSCMPVAKAYIPYFPCPTYCNCDGI